MGVKTEKYVDLVSRYINYGDNGYYVESSIIYKMIVDELNLSMTYQEIRGFVNNCEILLTEEEIKAFLDKRMNERNLDLRRESGVGASIQYFKTYISILKEKCKTLFDIVDDLNKVRGWDISEGGWKRLVDLDFHLNGECNIYYLDVERLVDAIVYNVKDLYDKVNQGNSLETYLNFRVKRSDGEVTEDDLYPRKEVQVKDLYYNSFPEFIALSGRQREGLMDKELESYSRLVKMDWLDDGDIDNRGSMLVRKK